MCGICGYLGIDEPGLLERMTAALLHRGPDDSGLFFDRDVGLGHRRLSIIDLSGGHQPMTSPDGNLVIAFNGEIYNFAELRAELEARGHRFETGSDTEVLLRMYQVHGVDALQRLNGMFAFAVYDRSRRELFLARDRVGIKPLYYVPVGDGLLFASETKALLQHAGWDRSLNTHALRHYLGLRYVPGDRGLLREVRKLPPGHYLMAREGSIEVRRYWAPPVPEPGDLLRCSEEECLDQLAELMQASVQRRLISDVSFGAYLSGGLDSSLIVALMAKLVDKPIKTFSVGFDYEHDELTQAAATAKLLRCDHHELQTRGKDIALLPDVVWHSDDPLGDAISIPMFQLAREAKKQVTVILTGEGGDEVFAGYLFHKAMWAAGMYRKLAPSPVRRWLVQPLLSVTPAALMNLAFKYPAHLGARGKLKVLDYHRMLSQGTLDQGYRHLISLFDARDTQSLFTPEFDERLRADRDYWTPEDDPRGPEFDRMLRLQFGHWLPDNMLLRNDKMSMASGIEGRVPFLDHTLIEFAFRLPKKLRLRGMTGKYLLRRLAERLLPRETAQRKKMPFYVPMENYYEQGGFVDMMDELLGERAVRERGVFRPEAVAELRAGMHRREFILVKQVFSLMTLELWFRAFVDAPAGQRLPATASARDG
ncbi:MAG: asparagine synthase (glutamine-hydrolyzing) [Planctomycetes bacterium]|nr:asparagine synthase (glutamine-hydrolyzing) [Planctomycetota bacterium]